MTRRLSVLLLVVSVAGWTAGCASSAGPVQPLPFPGAPAPPMAPVPARPAPLVTPETTAEALVTTALAYRGVKYVYGGADPATGFDCSGFVQYVFAQHAIGVARTVPDQFRQGLPVRLVDLRPGDLVFFSTTGPGPTHVGIAVSRDQFVHAPNSNGVVRVEAVDSPYWHNRFLGARRLF